MGIETAILGSAVLGAYSANKAAKTQAGAATKSADMQYQMWKEQQALQAPWRQAGEQALNKLTPLAMNYTPFSQTNWQMDPGYQFRMAEGLKGIDRSMAARGLGMSGPALKAAARFGQDYASQEYQNAFNRYQAERQAQLGPLQSLAGIGQTSANTLGAAGQNYANAAGQAYQNAAAAQAAGNVGVANAMTGGLGTYMNYTQNQNLLNALRTPTSYTAPTGTGLTNTGYDFSGISTYG